MIEFGCYEFQVAQVCTNCGVNMGEYFCGICKFYDDDIEKKQYHCDDCGICRVGGRENFFHCKKCGPIILPALYFAGPELPEDVVKDPEYHDLYKFVSTCGRLLNDIHDFEREGKGS